MRPSNQWVIKMIKDKGYIEFKTCAICHLSIDLAKEHHLILNENRGITIIAVSYYHSKCFGDKFLVQHKLHKLLDKTLVAMKGVN